MTKDKFESLTKYLAKLTDRLSSPIPEKHKNNPDTFKSFLNREIRVVKEQLEQAKLEGAGK
jgi:hypothetical protein